MQMGMVAAERDARYGSARERCRNLGWWGANAVAVTAAVARSVEANLIADVAGIMISRTVRFFDNKNSCTNIRGEKISNKS